MTAKAYLQRVKSADAKINNKLEELERLESLATKVTASLNGDVVSGTRNPDKMTDAVARIIELQEEINQSVDEYINIKKEVNAELLKLEKPNHYRVLHSRYILYKTWERIACDMNCSYQWVCKLHGFALVELEKILIEEGLANANDNLQDYQQN